MALREIREQGDAVLNKICKEVTEMTDRTRVLIEDMIDTMHDAEGVGLAAPQVGILKRIVVIDVSEDANDPIVMINPEIIETSGEQKGSEGCLSVPGMVGIVTRPDYAKAKALDINMQPFEIEGEGLLARAICHELDHLDGKLYVDLVEGPLMTNEEFREMYYGDDEEEDEEE
ncbi:MAG: peptide deformylase [Lachnospiraceae bacterium]|nr:peptide deformylase [Lachnospiraceae bacterium]